jgi:acyl-CoA thioester hydrolase
MNQFIFPLKIYIEDTDYSGLVFHSNYLKYYERARSEWIDQNGMDMAWQMQQRIHFVIKSIQIDFLKPVRLGDMVEVVSRVSQVKAASIMFDQHLRLSSANYTILNKAQVHVVCVNEYFQPIGLPACFLHDLSTGEIE